MFFDKLLSVLGREFAPSLYKVGNSRQWVGIDKLEIELASNVLCEEVGKRMIALKKPVTRWKDKDGGYNYFGIEGGITLRLSQFYSRSSKRVIVNPTHFNNYKSLCDQLEEFLGSDCFYHARVRRLDFAVTLPIPFIEIRSGLDVVYKRSVRDFTDKIPTGFHFGKGEEKVSIYDYGIKHFGIAGYATRIEVKYTGRKIPITYFQELPKLHLLLKESELKPFLSVKLNKITLVDSRGLKSSDLIRLGELRVGLSLAGYGVIKRTLNINNNFLRNYGKLFFKEPLDLDLNKSFELSLLVYFQEDQKVVRQLGVSARWVYKSEGVIL